MAKAKDKLEIEDTAPEAVFVVGGKEYRPRVGHTILSWGRILPALEKGATRQKLYDILTYTDKEHKGFVAEQAPKLQQNHHDFVGYLYRHGNIAVKS